MKIKRPLCSTGHGTGKLLTPDLGVILERERHRKIQKKHARVTRLAERVGRVSKLSGKSRFVLFQRISSLAQHLETGKAVMYRLTKNMRQEN